MVPAPRPDEPQSCNTFTEFVERIALPRLLENPRAQRLDGQDGVGNRKVAGRFYFAGRQWRVNSDTQFEPVLLAYWHARPHGEAATFEQAATGSGERFALVPELERLKAGVPQYRCIYAE